MKCCQESKKLFGIFKRYKKHSFVITNAFYTLTDSNLVDLAKTCIYCGAKEAFGVDKQTLMELVDKFPNAFEPLLLEYLKSWQI